MRFSIIFGAALVAAFFIPQSPFAFARHHPVRKLAFARHDHVIVYRAPSKRSRQIAVLMRQMQVRVLSREHLWIRVALWASIHGWVRKADLVFHKLKESASTYRPPEIHYRLRPTREHRLAAIATATSRAALCDKPGGTKVGSLPAGSRVTVAGWKQDAHGKIWYKIGRGWAEGTPILFRSRDPGLEAVRGQKLWRAISGKGMWLTLGVSTRTMAQSVVQAARANGITHLYVEAAISPLGFYGRDSDSLLLAAAHQRHLKVVAWVYPYLYDIAADIRLTRQVARYRSQSGDRFDGIAADLERNATSSTVRPYSQLIRAYLGPKYPLVAVPYSPQSSPSYPFAELARHYNAIAPMDYWHETKSHFGDQYGHMRYGFEYGHRYAVESVTAIRKTSGHVPVIPIGQTFDDFGRLGLGPHSPSAAEIKGFLSGCKQTGTPGASFFQWMTTTESEWRAIRAFRFR